MRERPDGRVQQNFCNSVSALLTHPELWVAVVMLNALLLTDSVELDSCIRAYDILCDPSFKPKLAHTQSLFASRPH